MCLVNLWYLHREAWGAYDESEVVEMGRRFAIELLGNSRFSDGLRPAFLHGRPDVLLIPIWFDSAHYLEHPTQNPPWRRAVLSVEMGGIEPPCKKGSEWGLRELASFGCLRGEIRSERKLSSLYPHCLWCALRKSQTATLCNNAILFTQDFSRGHAVRNASLCSSVGELEVACLKIRWNDRCKFLFCS